VFGLRSDRAMSDFPCMVARAHALRSSELRRQDAVATIAPLPPLGALLNAHPGLRMHLAKPCPTGQLLGSYLPDVGQLSYGRISLRDSTRLLV
jgi:hypothetical protein